MTREISAPNSCFVGEISHAFMRGALQYAEKLFKKSWGA